MLHRALILILAAALSASAAISLKKPSARKHAPAFELTDASGRKVKLADYAGKVVLIDFWATWCGPCKTEIPWLVELRKQYESKGVEVLGISMDEDGWTIVKPFMEKFAINYPVVLGNKRVAYLYGDIDALPVAFFIDRDQRVAAIHAGQANRKDVEKVLESLLDGK